MGRSIRDRLQGTGRPTVAPDAPLMRLLRRGVFAREVCSHYACQEVLTARCNYVDRRGKACPTHWCAKHAHGVKRKPYCPAHVVTMSPPQRLEYRQAVALDWVARAVDDDMVALLRRVAARLDENLMSEPVKFGAVGLERVRIWERTWKTYSELGIGCRVSLGIADREPDFVQLRFNSNVVTTMTTPWDLVSAAPPRECADRMAKELIVPAEIAVDVWLKNAVVQLRGSSVLPRH